MREEIAKKKYIGGNRIKFKGEVYLKDEFLKEHSLEELAFERLERTRENQRRYERSSRIEKNQRFLFQKFKDWMQQNKKNKISEKQISKNKPNKCKKHNLNNKRPILPLTLKWEILERDNFACQFCGSRQFLEIDHIIPVSKNGKTKLDNLQTLCKNCNREKSNHLTNP